MYKGRRIAAVVPAYNEELLIGKTLADMPDLIDVIVAVDDCSTDTTLACMQESRDPRLQIVALPENQGVGGAVIAGHRAAIQAGAEIMVVLAGDNQMDPIYLPDLLEPIVTDGYGFTKGNRFYSRESLNGMPRLRVMGNMALTFLNKAASGYWHIADPQNGYTAVTAESLAQVPLDRVSKRYDFENDLLVWLSIAGVRAKDVRIPSRYGAETSTLAVPSTALRLSVCFFRGFWRRMWLKYMLWSFSPIALLFGAGLFLTGAGMAVGLWASAAAFTGTSPTAGTTVLAVLPFLCGFVLLTQALVLDIQESPD